MINVDELRKAMERPRIVIDGVSHEGKLLSWPRWSYWTGRLTVWYGGTLSDEEAKADIAQFLDEMGLPSEKILALEAPIVLEAVHDFFALHRQQFKQAAAAAPAN